MKHTVLGTEKYLDDCRVGSDYLARHIYHVVYLSSKGPTDCVFDIEVDGHLAVLKMCLNRSYDITL